MMTGRRQLLLREAAAFVGGAGIRPRAVLLVGPAGIGKTTMLDQLQVEILAGGCADVIVIDDAHELDAARIEQLRQRLEADSRARLILGCQHVSPELGKLVKRSCERRVFDVPALAPDEARAVLAELGMQPWTLRAGQLIESSDGNPRMLIDRSLDMVDVELLPSGDASIDSASWTSSAAQRLEAIHLGSGSVLELVDRLELVVDDEHADGAARADAESGLAEIKLRRSQLEEAIRYGERAAARDQSSDAARILGAAFASGARAMRGEPTAMLSLHALAGRASRASLPIVETALWHLIGWCAGNLGDVATSRRAMVRSIQLADSNAALLLGLQARLGLADLQVATGDPAGALEYYAEVAQVAASHQLDRFRIDALAGAARARIAVGQIDAACTDIDAALELVLRVDANRHDVVDVAVIAARAYAAAGSIELALAPLDALTAELGDSGSPDFWLVLEAIRVHGRAGIDPAAFQSWLLRLAQFDADGHGGALRAAHAEADAWRAAVDGRRAEAARLAQRARQLWVAAECHDELALTDPIMLQAPIEHGPRISLVGSSTVAPAEDPEAFEVLTKREREIARYVAGGLTNPEIASELHLSPRTVEHHVASILRKLELPSRRALVRGRV